jgi:hypothetical protein
VSAHCPDEDPVVFQARGGDRIASLALVEALIGLGDGLWNEWRGPKDDRPPRELTQGELSRLLRPFGIRAARAGQHIAWLQSDSCRLDHAPAPLL